MGGETTKKCEGVADVKRELVGMVVVWGQEAVAETGPVQGGVWEAGRAVVAGWVFIVTIPSALPLCHVALFLCFIL